MDYVTFLERLREDPCRGGALRRLEAAADMIDYLSELARRILTELSREPSKIACNQLAAVSGLVRAVPPEAVIVLDRPDTAVLAAACLDIAVPRRLRIADCSRPEGWTDLEHTEAAEIRNLAHSLDLVLADQAFPPPGKVAGAAFALITAHPDAQLGGATGLRHVLRLHSGKVPRTNYSLETL